MLKYLIEFKLIIFTIILFSGFLIFRRELNKLLDWLVGFRKIAGVKGDYKVSAETESPGSTSKLGVKEEEAISIDKKVEVDIQEKPAKEKSWISFLVKKDYGKALEILEKDLNSEHDNEKRNKITAFIGYAKLQMNSKKGIEYFEDALKKTQGSPDVYHWYALSYSYKKKYKEAISITQKGIDANPTSSFLRNSLADFLVQESKEIEALEMLFEELKQNPEISTHYTKIAEILSEMGKKELARDCCRMGVENCPDDTSILEIYGSIVSEMEDYQEAMLVYLRLATRNPKVAKFWALLGNQYLMLDFDDLALEAYKKGNELSKESEGWIISNIGNLMNNRGFHTEGASYLQKTISIEPNSQYAHDRLGKALKQANDQVEKRIALEKEILQVVRDYKSPEEIITEAKVESSQQNSSNDG
ncbi:tetratricopeptide repeat protein [Thermodesulfobacteriota bacterium]